jgi:hypothetical protein
MTSAVKRDMGRRAAIEPVIGQLKNEHRIAGDPIKPFSPPPHTTSVSCSIG